MADKKKLTQAQEAKELGEKGGDELPDFLKEFSQDKPDRPDEVDQKEIDPQRMSS